MKNKKILLIILVSLVVIVVTIFMRMKYVEKIAHEEKIINDLKIIADYITADKKAKYGLIEDYSQEYETGYYLYIPQESVESEQLYPLVIHLHGSNARGDGKKDLKKVTWHGFPTLVEKAEEYKFFALAPQSRRSYPIHLEDLIDDLIEKYPIDKSRVYLTGVSMGGGGTWQFAQVSGEKLAAIVPICSNYYLNDKDINRFKDIPIWIFHGEKDQSTPMSYAKTNVKKLEDVNPNLKYRFYENADHGIWYRVYSTDELYLWLLEQVNPNI